MYSRITIMSKPRGMNIKLEETQVCVPAPLQPFSSACSALNTAWTCLRTNPRGLSASRARTCFLTCLCSWAAWYTPVPFFMAVFRAISPTD